MTESLDDRKKQLISECRERYAPQRRKWWQRSLDDSYRYTWDIYTNKNYPRVFADEIIIRRNKSEGLTAFGVCIGLGLPFAFFMWLESRSLFSILIAVMTILLSIYFFAWSRDRSPKIILNKEGLWTIRWKYFIPWQDMVVSCIRENSSGEDRSYHIRIHFYDEQADRFGISEYNLGGLEKEPDTIACFIHQFRLQYGNTQPGA